MCLCLIFHSFCFTQQQQKRECSQFHADETTTCAENARTFPQLVQKARTSGCLSLRSDNFLSGILVTLCYNCGGRWKIEVCIIFTFSFYYMYMHVHVYIVCTLLNLPRYRNSDSIFNILMCTTVGILFCKCTQVY